MNRRTRSRYLLPATAMAFGLLAYGCNHAQSTAPSYGGAQVRAEGDGGGWADGTAPTETGPRSMDSRHMSSESASMADPTATNVGATNRQGTATATRTWGGVAENQSPDTQYGPSAAVGNTADISALSDAQLAAVLEAVNQGEIQQGQAATTRASAAGVKRFANHMVAAHRMMLGHVTAILSRAQITPSDNAVSNQLKSDAHAQLATLQAMRGREFDRAYVDAQVSAHSQALELLDRIIPNLRNPDLKNDVQNARPRVEEHLREAERLQQELQAGQANAQGGSMTTSPGHHAGSGHDMDAGM
jgi:putative membrane protein